MRSGDICRITSVVGARSAPRTPVRSLTEFAWHIVQRV
jgi:hypothetical protein